MPKDNYLQEIREITKKNNIVLIFDEVRTGFRVNMGGAQKFLNVIPDLSTFGKAMANGYDIAALVGKKEIMEVYKDKAYIRSTYFENSLAMIAAIETINLLEENKEEFARFQDELSQVSHDAVKIGGKIAQMEARLEHLETEIANNEERISSYYKSEEKIESNHKLNEQISDITQQLSKLQMDNIDVDNKYKGVLSTLSVAKNQKQNIERDIQELIDTEQKILDYDLYLMTLSKDGIPYELIAKAIPAIEREVNHVLENMMAGFHIELDMKDKNIDAFICYADDKWNLELSSGMERFVSSLAIRIGLINVSTLPRPNFIIVDEGFGTLDSDNIANMEGAFQYLKTQFDFVMIITHLDTIKDYMDMLIPININNGLSKVIYS